MFGERRDPAGVVVRRTQTSLACAALAFAVVGGCASKKTVTIQAGDALVADRHTTQPSTRPIRPARGVMEHQRVALDADALRQGHFRHTIFHDALSGITLRDPRKDFPFTGTWQSDTIEPEFTFTELLPSWNATVPADAGVRFDVRVRDAKTAAWSPWLYIGYWGRVLRDQRVIAFDGGKVETDILELSRPADAYEIRATLESFRTAAPIDSPILHRINVVASRAAINETATTQPARVTPIDLAVPFRAQGVEAESIRSSVCSPTSVTMVLAWAGTERATEANCMAIWDDDYALFGTWNRAIQLAGTLGHEAYLERYSSMDNARATLAGGQPIIASIRFKAGEFPSNLQKSTAGHLIVLRGIDADGDIICNDPASRDRGNGIIYKANELAVAWLKNTGGVGYIIKKK